MRLFAIHPGSDIATGDTHVGLVAALRRAGHEVEEWPLAQRIDRWANWLDYNYRIAVEKDASIPTPTWADSLYLAGEQAIPRALRWQPDWVLIVSGMYLHPDLIVLLRRAGLRLALVCTESPYDDVQQFRVLPLAHLAWTNERRSVDVLKYALPTVRYLPCAYDPERHNPAAVEPDDLPPVPSHDVVFVGTGFAERIELLEAVDWTGLGIDLGLYGGWEFLAETSPLRAHIKGGRVDNAYTAALYRRAKIGLNLYRQSVGYGPDVPRILAADSLNPRAVELAAAGVFTLSDPRAEVAEVFGGLVPTFTTAKELEALVRRWLPDDAGRRQVAAQLPGRVAGRTFDAMAAQVVGDMEGSASSGVSVTELRGTRPEVAATMALVQQEAAG